MGEGIPVVVEVDCIGCGLCAEVCPEVFSFNDFLGYPLVVNPEGAGPEKLQEVMDLCPSNCIIWSAERPAG